MKHLASTILSTLFSVQLLFSSLSAVRAQQNVNITGTVSQAVVVSFVVSAPPSAVVNQPFPVTITAKDADGFTTSNVPQDLTVTTTNGGTISPTTISRNEFTDDGIWTGTMTLSRIGEARTIIVSSGPATGQTTIDILSPAVEPPPSPGLIPVIQEVAKRVREFLKENPVTQTLIEEIFPVFTPILTTTAVITALTPAFVAIGDVFLYTSYLWSLLLEFLGLKRGRRPWGVVYNAETKEPLPMVVVQLVDANSPTLIERRVTDAYGRYGFLVKEGRYLIVPSHPDFTFPSKISPETGDLRYSDLYHGEEIVISDSSVVLAVNIPMDPLTAELPQRSSFLQLSFRRLSFDLLLLSLFLQGLVIFLTPTPRNIILFAAYLMLVIVVALFVARRHRTWGIVYDSETKKELADAQVFITQEEDPRFASRRITDESGRFYLLLPKGTYRLAVQLPDYQFPAPVKSFGYKGETISVSPKNPLVHVDIPLVRTQPGGSEEPAPGFTLRRSK